MFALVIVTIAIAGLMILINVFAFADTDKADTRIFAAVNFTSLVLTIVTLSLMLHEKF